MTAAARGLSLCLLLLTAAPALAQSPSTPAGAAPPQAPSVVNDRRFIPAEPDFTLIALPTSLRLPAGKWGFRVTHRFTRDLGDGSFGDLASDFFGFDSSSIVGLELRYGLRPGLQLALLRTSDRTIQWLAQASVLRQTDTRPFAVDAVAGVQGLDNFTELYTGTFGAILSRRFGERGALYAEPWLFVNPFPESGTADDTSLLLGLGGRVQLGTGSGAYLVGEWTPRLAGSDSGDDHLSVAIEKRTGGHAFQINFSNSFATTLGQVARGYGANGGWHIGFNISRKFYR